MFRNSCAESANSILPRAGRRLQRDAPSRIRRAPRKRSPCANEAVAPRDAAEEGPVRQVRTRRRWSCRGGPLPIVAVGASAGGLEAFTEFFRLIPADSGLAFVVLQHLDPAHGSFLSDALARVTSMRVQEIPATARASRRTTCT